MLFMRLSGVLAKIILARTITPYEYGVITLVVISLPALFQLFSNLSMYDMMSHSRKGKDYFGFSLIFSTVVIVLISVLFFIFHEVFFEFVNLPLDSWESTFLALIISALPVCILTDFMGFYRGLRKYSLPTQISMIPSILRLVFIAAAVYVFNIRDFFSIMLIFSTPSFVTLIYYLLKYYGTIRDSLRKINKPSKEMWAFGLSLFIVGSFLSSEFTIIKIVVSHMLGVEWQGYFDVSLTLVSILTFFSATMNYITIPEVTREDFREESFAEPGGLWDLTKALFAYLIFAVIILYFYADSLVVLLFSESYAISAGYTSMLAIGSVFLFVQRYTAYLDISLSKNIRQQKALIIVTLFFIIVLPIFTYALIAMFGFPGAYISVTILSILYTISTVAVSKNKHKLRFLLGGSEKLLLPVLVTFAFIYFTGLSFLLGLASASVLYTLLLFSSRYVSRKIFTDFFRK